MHELLDKLDVIECFEDPGCTLRVGEILNKQKATNIEGHESTLEATRSSLTEELTGKKKILKNKDFKR